MWREYDQAEKYLKKAAPQAPAAWYGLSRLYLLEGQWSNAQKWLRKALAQQPGDEQLKRMLAAAKAKNLDAELRQLIEGPGRPEKTAGTVPVGEAWQMLTQGKASEAEKAFRAILENEPENFGARNGLGFALLNTGEPDAAKAEFEKCLEAEPGAAGPMNGLARSLYSLDQVDEAIATWEKMYEKYPGPNAAAVGLAQSYLEREEYAKAIPFFAVLVKAHPDEAQYQEGLKAAQEGAKAGQAEPDK
jgi:tetratricopeptide (TPR) repeat protein